MCNWLSTQGGGWFDDNQSGFICKTRSTMGGIRGIIIISFLSCLFSLPITWIVKTLMIEVVFKYTKGPKQHLKHFEAQVEPVSSKIATKVAKEFEYLKVEIFKHRMSLARQEELIAFNKDWNLRTDVDFVEFMPTGYPTKESILTELDR